MAEISLFVKEYRIFIVILLMFFTRLFAGVIPRETWTLSARAWSEGLHFREDL
jgi:hypothetical protein